MSDFLLFMNSLRHRFPFHMEIYYSSIMDWCIKVWKEGCAKQFPNSPHDGEDAVMADVQDCDLTLCFAKAHAAVKK